MKLGSLFTGIGGIDLGFEVRGFDIRWQIENNSVCREVLKLQWPDVPLYGDIKDINPKNLEEVDCIVGGFPCKPISQAAARSELGEDWLWPEFNRILKELKPKYVVIENVEAFRYKRRGLGIVLNDLSNLGYDARWNTLRASYFGAPHHRARVWVVAYPNSYRKPDLSLHGNSSWVSKLDQVNREWSSPPRDLEVAYGVSKRMVLRAYGNAVVPVVAEFVASRILENEERS